MITQMDISRVDNVHRDPQRVQALLRALACNAGTMASIATIQSDIALSEGGTEIKNR